MRDPYRRRSERVTAVDIIAKLFSAKGVTLPRVRKAQALAVRAKLEWSTVFATMTDEQRQAVTDAQ